MAVISKGMKALQDENERLEQETERLNKALLQATQDLSTAYDKIGEEKISRVTTENTNRLLNQQINDIKKELSDLTNVKTVISEIKSCISTPSQEMKDKIEWLKSQNERLFQDNERLQSDNHRLMQDFQRLGYIQGKVDAYERMANFKQGTRSQECDIGG